jgi:hypothetical protein
LSDLWKVLGHDRVAADVAKALAAGNGIVLLEGPPGIGKSGLAQGIAEVWESSDGSVVLTEGDSFRSDVAYYPLSFTMAQLQPRWRSLGSTAADVARAGETLAGTAGIITATIQALVRARRAHGGKRTLLLEHAEQDILVKLERLSKKGPPLLVADNLHWWDSRSLEFLSRLRTAAMRDAFPFLADLRVLAVQTPEPFQALANPATHEALLATADTSRFELERIPRETFGDVLVALGAPSKPSEEVTEVLHALTGGHLVLARRCATLLAEGDVAPLLETTDFEEFRAKLLSARIRSLGEFGKQAEALLRVAAVWGLTFHRDEVMCVTEGGEVETARLLRYCRDEEVVRLSNGQATFVHELLRQYFLSLATDDKAGVHERMSDCLRRRRPAEYDLRCVNALDAEQKREAAAFGVQAAMQRQREGRSWIDLPRAILEAIERGGMTPIVADAAAALEHLREYRFRECLNTLDALPHKAPKRLRAERDYLRAMTLMSTRSENDRAAARSILSAWKDYQDEEPELWTRLMQLLLYGLCHVRDKAPGLELEARLTQFLTDRVDYDPAAEDALYTLDRCSSGLYPADVSVVRIGEAVKHFGPGEGQTLVRRPVEYYRCLVNLGAAWISNGEYEKSRAVHRDIERLVEGYITGVFPRVDLPRMNQLLAEYRAGVVDAAGAAARQAKIAASPAVANDPFYPNNALAVYLALAGRHDEALAIFDEIDGRLSGSRADPEPSMIYLIRANRCMTRLVAGAVEGLAAEWDALAPVVESISYPSRGVYVRRHELLARVIAEGAPNSASALDECLIVRHPDEVGPLWKDYGHAFMLPSVEIWREN